MKIICYGDSNTYGYDPRSFVGDRYDRTWPEVLAEKTGHTVTAMGMPGRQIPFRARPLEAMHEQIREHVDILMVMLGSNDIEASLNVKLVEARMNTMIKEVLRWNAADRIILIGPPPLKVTKQHLEASREMNNAFAGTAARLGVEYIDSFDWPLTLCFDKTHLTEDDQEIFADEIIKRL